MKTIKILLLTIITFTLISTPLLSYAEDDATSMAMDFLQEINTATNGDSPTQQLLPQFAIHENAVPVPGEDLFISTIYKIIDLMKYSIGGLALIYFVISGFNLVMAGEDAPEEWTQQKRALLVIITTLLIVFCIEEIVGLMYGEQGETFDSLSSLKAATGDVNDFIRGLVNTFEVIVGALTIFYMVYAAIQLMVSMGDENQMKETKLHILYCIIGIVIIATAEGIVKLIIYPEDGKAVVDASEGVKYVVMITNFVTSMISLIAVPMLVYGGYLLVVSTGNEEIKEKGKKVILGAIIGLVIALGSYAAVNTFVDFQDTETIEEFVKKGN